MSAILIVDDIPENIRLLAQILKDEGYDIGFAKDGKKALVALEAKPYDLILLDIMMPVMDGFEACEYIKNDNKLKDIPIIFLSAKNEVGDIVKGFELGGADYVTKPFNQTELLSRIKTHLSLKTLTDSLKDEVKKEVLEHQKKEDLLIQQGKLAAVGEMIEDIAHQWRQPLNALSMMIQNLKYQKMAGVLDDETLNKSVDDGVEITQFLSQTIDDFRDFFKTSGKLEYFTYKEAVDNVLRIVGMNLRNRNIEIIINIDEESKIYANKNEFLQVLLNLINNAKDAIVETACEHKKIFISLKREDDIDLFYVSDRAGGVDDKIKETLFDSKISTKIDKDGSGIGLYISKRIINEHFNGTLHVENIEEDGAKGASFIMSLPYNELRK